MILRILFLVSFASQLFAQGNFNALIQKLSPYTDIDRPQVMVIGTFHFNEYAGDNSGNSYTADVPDMMTAKRQAELEELIDAIKKFGPTKICIEVGTELQSKIDEEFNQYTNTGNSAKRNEYIQFGFRLANKCNHHTVYAVDADNSWYLDSVMQFGMQHGQANRFMEVGQMMPELLVKQYASYDSMHTIDIYRNINNEADLKGIHLFHQSLCSIGKEDNYIGTNLYHDWMHRNSKIFTNVLRIAEPNDRIIVLYGAAHIHSLKTMFGDSYDFDVEELSALLDAVK